MKEGPGVVGLTELCTQLIIKKARSLIGSGLHSICINQKLFIFQALNFNSA